MLDNATDKGENMAHTDLRVVKTLQQIDRAFLECLAQTPFDKITVDMLCRRALINRSTFYAHYTGKANLMERFLGRTLDEFRRVADVAFVNSSPERIQDGVYQKNFQNVLVYLDANRSVYELLWSLPLEDSVFHRMVEIISQSILDALPEAVRANSARTPMMDLYAHLFSSNMMTLVRWWFDNAGTVSAKDVQNLMSRNMGQGLFRIFRDLLG